MIDVCLWAAMIIIMFGGQHHASFISCKSCLRRRRPPSDGSANAPDKFELVVPLIGCRIGDLQPRKLAYRQHDGYSECDVRTAHGGRSGARLGGQQCA